MQSRPARAAASRSARKCTPPPPPCPPVPPIPLVSLAQSGKKGCKHVFNIKDSNAGVKAVRDLTHRGEGVYAALNFVGSEVTSEFCKRVVRRGGQIVVAW